MITFLSKHSPNYAIGKITNNESNIYWGRYSRLNTKPERHWEQQRMVEEPLTSRTHSLMGESNVYTAVGDTKVYAAGFQILFGHTSLSRCSWDQSGNTWKSSLSSQLWSSMRREHAEACSNERMCRVWELRWVGSDNGPLLPSIHDPVASPPLQCGVDLVTFSSGTEQGKSDRTWLPWRG